MEQSAAERDQQPKPWVALNADSAPGLMLAMQVAERAGLLDSRDVTAASQHAAQHLVNLPGLSQRGQSPSGQALSGDAGLPDAMLRAYAQTRACVLAPAVIDALSLDRPSSPADRTQANAPDWAKLPHWPAGWTSALLMVALLSGLLVDRIGPSHAINLLAAPLLGLVAWNLASYLMLAVQAIWRPRQFGPSSQPAWWKQQMLAAAQAWALRQASGSANAATDTRRYQARTALLQQRWASAMPVLLLQLQARMHLAAIAVAIAAVAALYWRGLTVDYRAGWESTFLSAAGVQALLGTVLQPAAALSGIALPDLAGWQAMQFAAGAAQSPTGVPAASWLHLLAITALLAIVLPRALLAALAHQQARRAAAHWPWPLPAGEQQHLRAELDKALTAQTAVDHAQADARSAAEPKPQPPDAEAACHWLIVPFNLTLDGHQQQALQQQLQRQHRLPARLTLHPSWPLADADRGFSVADRQALTRISPSSAGAFEPGTSHIGCSAPLFGLTATPELEVHGRWLERSAFDVQPVGAQPLAERPRLALIDIGSFRLRFTGAEGARRLQQRQSAWASMLADVGFQPLWVDLTQVDSP